MIDFAFNRKLRLLRHNHFNFVFCKPQRSVNTLNFIILNRLNRLNTPRIGIVISKKIIKLAHERNRVKRLIRESFRLRQKILNNMDFVVLIKKNVSSISNFEIKRELEQLWRYYYR